MSLSGYAPTLRLERRPSPRLALVLTLFHCGAWGILPTIPLALWIKFALAAVVGLSLARSLGEHALVLGSRAVTRMIWEPSGTWLLERNGRLEPARLLRGSFMHPRLAVLDFALETRRTCSVVLPQDGVDRESFRRLRVRLTLDGAEVEEPFGAAAGASDTAMR
ncbi:MAG: protein YgfX [Gammaproteobacteria bacterium]